MFEIRIALRRRGKFYFYGSIHPAYPTAITQSAVLGLIEWAQIELY